MAEQGNAGAYTKTPGWTLSPYHDLSHAFVFVREPIAVLVLDRLTLLALELCTGHSWDAAVERFAEITTRDPESSQARSKFQHLARQLERQRLIAPTGAAA
ncbi:hypothetical protein [Actinacidiphila glaucinigra]|uniref:Uncharacterized protein n=1 Tax=Actinacidiphila glaucinigra TaxID=235986 RepID=A0A239IQS0_9ACTN|nr:hypothetical protein [Actinacidiphila glaucinigra]SNS95413.1 hypothetical protein SAMN05216252_11156 [Actinacidiphila glaucinigra]